ncbi:MAG: L,D-transpeptidase family protein [Azoarcus sp.]|jgi:murein L,D-transpeptidase YafK|nr:L,D-transpeptidase family protein [Azoarcus sp.]
MILARAVYVFSTLLVAGSLMTMLPVSAHAGRNTETDFLRQQKQYSRVREALLLRADALERHLGAHGLKSTDLNILIVAYKSEAVLDIYAKASDTANYKKLASYPVCASSGNLGPKRSKGDGQVPEGFYRIDRFNPVSSYHLSLGINYPNAADRRNIRAVDPGGDIFIHGSCVTIGCLPMTDAVIEEIYLYAVYARSSGQKAIPVYIFPFRMTQENMEKYTAVYNKEPEKIAFWQNIKKGHDEFVKTKKTLTVNVTKNGNYKFDP